MFDFGGLDACFGIVANFDPAKIDSPNYGYECWKIFWKAAGQNVFDELMAPKFYFFTADNGSDAFCICAEILGFPNNKKYVDRLEENLLLSKEFLKVASEPAIQWYDKSMGMQYGNPFISALELEAGNFYIKNEYGQVVVDAYNAVRT